MLICCLQPECEPLQDELRACLRRVTQSSSCLISTLSDAPHAHHTLAADNTHRAHELAKLQQAAKLNS